MSQNDASSIVNLFQQAVKGLLVISESDYPIEVALWQGQPLTIDRLLQSLNQPDAAPVATVELEAFLGHRSQVQEWHGNAERSTVQQFQALVKLIQDQLTEVQVYRVGEIAVDVYIVGRVKNADDWIVLSTRVIET
jgi:hypothetical protein